MRGFQIWPQNLNRITFDPLFGQKTVEKCLLPHPAHFRVSAARPITAARHLTFCRAASAGQRGARGGLQAWASKVGERGTHPRSQLLGDVSPENSDSFHISRQNYVLKCYLGIFTKWSDRNPSRKLNWGRRSRTPQGQKSGLFLHFFELGNFIPWLWL